jgi:aminopeptidase
MSEHDFEAQMSRYADLLIGTGVNLREGQRLIVRGEGSLIQVAPLVRAVVARAYRQGARYVDVIWTDEGVTRARLQHAREETLTEYPGWLVALLTDYAENGDALLSLVSADPFAMADQSPDRLATVRRVAAQHAAPFRTAMSKNHTNWCAAAAAVPGWADHVFPDLPADERTAALWDAIFRIVRLDQPDPAAAWQQHIDDIRRRRHVLNARQYDALHFRAPGTDLRVGLPAGHLWEGAQSTTTHGITFTPNMPTEELFTLPHRLRVDGTVTASMPLSMGGSVIDRFHMRFEAGRVVEAHAEVGEHALRHLLETDEGAGRLGEVALVSADSPIARSGRLFYNTLFDENAACHIALGRAYHYNLPNGEQLSDAEFTAAGGNLSLIHVDFMIGSEQIDVDGVHADGSAEPLMRNGLWAF